MEKLTACFEISSNAIKVLIGYELGGAPVVLLRRTKPFPGLIKDGQITDPNGLIRALAELHTLDEPEKHLRISISEICLVLPSIGLTVYQNDKTTNVVSPTNEIAKIDISNVISLVRKEAVPGGNIIVDIIPDEFVLDDGARYANPPLGVKSTALMIKAKIHALPEALYNTYLRLLGQSGFRIKKSAVSAYCAAELFKTYPDLPKSYLLVDMGARLTTVSLIGEGSPYSSASFYSGGDDLTDEIAQAFDCPFEVAEKVKIDFGYKAKAHTYSPALPLGEDNLLKTPYYQKDLNALIQAHYEGYQAILSNAVSSLLSKYNGQLDNLPIVFTGGASGLLGLKEFMQKAFPGRECYFPGLRSVGARERGYASLLGLLLTSGKYVGSLNDNQRGVGTVSRLSKDPKAQKGKTTRLSAENDIL